MAKFSLSYVKKNPVMFGGIVIVFGLLFWLLMSGRGGTGAGSTQVVSTGPSEAFQAQAMSINAGIQSKQIDAAIANQRGAMELEALSRQLEGQENLAILQSQYMLAELESNKALTREQTAASLQALQSQLSHSLAATEANNQAMIDYASVAADSAVTQLAINAKLQRDMSADQLEAYKFGLKTTTDATVKQASLSAIGMLKKKDRDTALGAYFASEAGRSYSGGSGDDRITFGAANSYGNNQAIINGVNWG